MPVFVFNWLTATDVTSEEVADQFFASMKRHIPDHAPSVCGDVEPLAVPFNDVVQIRSLWQEGIHWHGKPGKRKGDYGIEGNVAHGKFWHTWIRHWYDSALPISEGAVGFLRETSPLFRVDFSYVHVFGDGESPAEDQPMLGLVSHDLQKWLPTIPWACCFGRPYLEMIERQRFVSAPFWKVEELGPESLLCQAAEDAADCLGPEFRNRRDMIKSTIGTEYFFDPTHPQKKAITPRFHFLRSRE